MKIKFKSTLFHIIKQHLWFTHVAKTSSIARRFSCILLLCFLSGFKLQDNAANLVIKAKIDYFKVDNIGNIYVVHGDELLKYLPSGKFFIRYSNLKLGNISSLDVTNPLKLLLYYHDFQQIVYLDDQLSANSDNISLEKLGYEQTALVCAGANNSFWIYNRQNNELLRFNEKSNKIAATGNLKQVLQKNLNPNFMLEYNGTLFLNCPENGIYVFDMFGAFSKIISLKNLLDFKVNENIIYYRKDGSLCSYNYKYFEEACREVPLGTAATAIQFHKNKAYAHFKDSLLTFNL
jgi:hypothetical protein